MGEILSIKKAYGPGDKLSNKGLWYSGKTYNDAFTRYLKKFNSKSYRYLITKTTRRDDSDVSKIFVVDPKDVIGYILSLNDNEFIIESRSDEYMDAANVAIMSLVKKYPEQFRISTNIIVKNYDKLSKEILDMEIISFELYPRDKN